MQALKERLTSKLGEKSKSKDKEGSSALKNSSSVDGKHSTLHDSHHHHQTASSSSSPSTAIAASTAASNAQSSEKGIEFTDKQKRNLSTSFLFEKLFFLF
jgi:hypothetical protein